MPSLAQGYIQSILQGLRMLPRLQELNKPKDPFEAWLKEKTDLAFDVLGGEGVGGGVSAVGPLGQALIEKKIGRDIDWPEEETASWQERSFEALNQAIQAGAGETKGVIESGQASPELLRALDMAGGKFFKNLVWPEEKTPKAPSADEKKRSRFRQWKELGDIPGFERTPEQQLDFEFFEREFGKKKKKVELLKKVTGKEFLKLAGLAVKQGDEEKAKTYIGKAAGLEKAEAEDIEHRFQTQEQLEQLEPGVRLMPPGMMGEPGQVISPTQVGGMVTPGFETEPTQPTGAVTEEDEFIEEARGRENMIDWDAVATKHPDWNLFYIKQKLGINE